jgi:D-galactarolactone cycloisomerase
MWIHTREKILTVYRRLHSVKIVSITPYFFVAPLAEPIADARNVITARSAVLIKVETEAGIIGWGEAASFAGCGALVMQVVRFFTEHLVGADASNPEAIYDRMYRTSLHFGRRGLVVNALSGIDVALWDIKGKIEGKPLFRLLGAQRESIQFYFNGGYFMPKGDSHAALARSVEGAIARGAPAVKIKIGRDLREDERRVATARHLLGSERDLMVDVNGILEIADLKRRDPIFREYRVRWLEEPVALGPMSGLHDVRKTLATPIAGYELEQTLDGWREIIEGDCVDIAQPDAIWSGGITECRRIAEIAANCETEFVPHNFATIISLAANAHLAAAAPTGGWLEVDSNENPFLFPLDRIGAFHLKNGSIHIPCLPGLGVEPDLEQIERFRVNIA